MVLPAPVGPTIAIFCPSFTVSLKSCIITLSSLYPNCTWSNVTLPFMPSVDIAFSGSFSSSGSSKNSSILSDAATIACSILEISAISFIGLVNCLSYWINDCILPTVIFPCTAKYPPKTAIPT